MAVNPSRADLAFIGCLAPSPERAAEGQSKVTDIVVALAVKIEEQAARDDDHLRELHHASKRESDTPGGKSNKRALPMPSSLCCSGRMEGLAGLRSTIWLVSVS